MAPSEIDPARTLALLWRHQTPTPPTPLTGKQGPKPSLTLDNIVATAINLGDQEGLEALTMRRVAQQVGVAPMSLYTYVAHKQELMTLMIDQACGEAIQTYPTTHWRVGVTAIAETNWALYQRHPWLLAIYSERPPLGPGVIGKYEHELQVFEGLGLTDIEMDAALSFVLNFVRSAVADHLQAARQQSESALSNQAWWEAHAPDLERWIPPGRYPLAERVGSAAGEFYGGAYQAHFAYTFGLQRVLDGLEPLLSKPHRKAE
jgi:AcrR family transcriptional regulator